MERLFKFILLSFITYACIILAYCIYRKVKTPSVESEEIIVYGDFFDASHDIRAILTRNPYVKKVIYIISVDNSFCDREELFADDDYVRSLVSRNLPFLSKSDWGYLLKKNAIATLEGVMISPVCLFKTPEYHIKENSKSLSVSILPDYLYDMINYCSERNILLRPVILPNPMNVHTSEIDAYNDLLQYYVGGVLNYDKSFVSPEYITESGALTTEGKEEILKSIIANINGEHSHEYVEINKVETIKKDSPVLRMIEQSEKVVFVGNSITDGCNNGGYGWYESLMVAFPDVKVGKVAYGGITTKGLLDRVQEIVDEKGDLYVFASGCNDIKVGNPDDGAAMYIRYLQTIVDSVTEAKPSARFVFVAPWQRWPETEIESLARPEYTRALENWCKANGHVFANPNPYIDDHIRKSKYFNYYMVDRTHPNSSHGMKLYSEAVVNSAHDFRN